MEYTTEQALEEIIRRRKQVKRRRDRKRCVAFAGMSCFLLAALTIVIDLMTVSSNAYSMGTAYGSFLLSPQAGGYVFTAVVAFAAGVSIAVYALRRNRNAQENAGKENVAQGDDRKENDKTENDEKEGET